MKKEAARAVSDVVGTFQDRTAQSGSAAQVEGPLEDGSAVRNISKIVRSFHDAREDVGDALKQFHVRAQFASKCMGLTVLLSDLRHTLAGQNSRVE